MSRSAGFLLVFSVMVFTSGSSARANLYNIANYPADQNGWNLTGTITTQGATATIVSVDITASNGVYTQNLNTVGAESIAEIVGNSLVVPTGSILDLDNGSTISPWDVVYYNGEAQPSYSLSIIDPYVPPTNGPNGNAWAVFPPVSPSIPGSAIGPDPMIIGTLQSSTVPEPTTLSMFSLLFGLGGMVYVPRLWANA